MHRKWESQNDGTIYVARNLVESLETDEHAELIIAMSRQEWLETHLAQLKAESQRLNDELKQVVLTYSSKIQLIDEMIVDELRECGRQDHLIDTCKERGLQIDEKARANGSG
ncbi:hypothetical protein [Lysinibacillus piscis]|uniref:Uncharacterized protein n=1 Tax=Lysinibacillus piscis TaxID=2518931 RepID=A0ABQ5NGM8_9BACI|nr:hypothetical protein [Lysinibacillus sp. KH24]GLC87523.1 hypothetical protein LYSBPC_06500 [Lysinibacillus sp. KH24]